MNRNDSLAQFSLAEAVELAHPLVQHIASEAKVRVLFVKGLTLQRQHLRQERPVADVDVLVEPDKVDHLVSCLAEVGWQPRPGAPIPGAPVHHAISLIHEQWPADIDLHRWMPGLHFIGTDEAFERLWKHRQLLSVGAQQVSTPHRVHALMIGVVHCLREPGNRSKLVELRQHREAFEETLNDTDRRLLFEEVAELRACEVMSPWLNELRTDLDASVRDLTPAQRKEWSLARHTSLAVIEAFRHSGWRTRGEIIRWVLWPPLDQLKLMPHVIIAPGTWGPTRARVQRLFGSAQRFMRAKFRSSLSETGHRERSS